jgi:two-component system chemotaxis response regulator CheB
MEFPSVATNSSTEHSFKIVAIGASAGGIEPLRDLLRQLPRDLPAAILIVVHRPPGHISQLAQVLSRKDHLHVITAHDGQALRPGVCFLGTPDGHLTIGPNLHLRLLPDGFYRGHNIDALFNSLAHHAGHRTIGVVLSGMLKDGTLGLRAIKEAGGVALVQAPEEATFSQMPLNAIRYDGPVDFVGPVQALAGEIRRLVLRAPILRPQTNANGAKTGGGEPTP